jgi:hypothetical protein
MGHDSLIKTSVSNVDVLLAAEATGRTIKGNYRKQNRYAEEEESFQYFIILK